MLSLGKEHHSQNTTWRMLSAILKSGPTLEGLVSHTGDCTLDHRSKGDHISNQAATRVRRR